MCELALVGTDTIDHTESRLVLLTGAATIVSESCEFARVSVTLLARTMQRCTVWSF